MLTIRPFRNADVPTLLGLWRKSQSTEPRLIPLSTNTLLLQVLGPPPFENRAIMIAFDDDKPVGYVHTTSGPTPDGYDLDPQTGQICLLAVDPGAPEVKNVARALLDAAEQYLIGRGAKEIIGGSPRPCAPFYIGFHGAAEAIGFFDSETVVIQAFQEAGYETFQTTVRFHLDLADYELPYIDSILEWEDKVDVHIFDFPRPKTWWEACAFANFEWLEAAATLKTGGRAVSRVRVRIANPDTEEADRLYKGCWDAGLMDVRVHPDFQRKGVAGYTLREMLRYLIYRTKVKQIEAHIADDSSVLYPLLRLLQWKEIDTGKIFRKTFAKK